MLLWGALGYVAPSALADTGVGLAAFNSLPSDNPYVKFVNAAYSAAGGSGNAKNPWGNGGVVGLAKLAGFALGGKTLYDYQKTGKLGAADLNAKLPFALGMILDDPSDYGAPSGGSGGGYW